MEQVLMRENVTDRTEQSLSAFCPKMAPFSCTWEGESSCFDLPGILHKQLQDL